MFDFLQNILGKEKNTSKNVAKERLRLVLVHDRSNVSPHILEALKEDMIKVISNYMEIDEEALEVSLSNEEDSVALVANIPILKMKRNYQG
ncbi:MAG: cell division topological specificity factor MinE [Thermoanaerobacteraceae bacterium]|nr:cell division topological specificity factor MinE [Thermoanaerobacteraceae bacterium]